FFKREHMKFNHVLFLTVIALAGIFLSCSSSEESQKTSQIITSSSGTNGVISPQGSISINKGSNITYTVTPVAGYHVDSVFVDGVSVGAVSNYTFDNIAYDHSIRATFASDGQGMTGRVDTVNVNKQNTERPLYNTQAASADSIPNGNFSVQIGSFKVPDNAARIVGLAKERFAQPVYLFLDKSDNSYKVVIGNFGTKDDARKFRDQMEQQFPNDYDHAWVRDNSKN
ncbi:MAG TPA: SPOR domain-containing protein, partial [Bacteroidota bacterium]|nr:SPOR domain-containing protein [Bacteroidota bacterium]